MGWRLAGAVTVAGGAAAGVTYAVKTVLAKQAETQATNGRASLAAMGGMDLPSGDLLDQEVEDPFVILGDWKKISTKSGRTRFESITTGKSQWRTPDEMPELEAVARRSWQQQLQRTRVSTDPCLTVIVHFMHM